MASIGTIVPARAAQWISHYLATSDKNRQVPGELSRNLVLNEQGELDLTLLNVKELKRISKQMKSRTLAHNSCDDATPAIVPIFEMPRSSAKKSQWINAIVNYIHDNDKSELYNILQGSRNGLSSNSRKAASRIVASDPAPVSTSDDSGRKSRSASHTQIAATSPRKRKLVAIAKSHVGCMSPKSMQKIAHKKSPTSTAKNSGRKSRSTSFTQIAVTPPKKKKSVAITKSHVGCMSSKSMQKIAHKSTSIHKHNMSSCTAATNKTMEGKPPTKPRSKKHMEEMDASMARSLQEHLYHDEIQRVTLNPSFNPFVGHSGDAITGNPMGLHPLLPPRYPVISSVPTSASSSLIRDEMNTTYKHASHLASKPAPIKVKKEPGNNTTTNNATNSHVDTTFPATTANIDDAATPQNSREQYMASALRNMGFTDMREILNGLRAVAAQREEICIVQNPTNFCDSLSYGNEWSQEAQIEEAMMWIVTQREEAAEAQKLDEARISSENAILAMEQSRKEREENQMRNACVIDLIGSLNGLAENTSRFFPHSIVLRSAAARQFLSLVALCENVDGKKQVIRMLQLEQKARKWYGTVLPHSYFEHVVCPLFEKWKEELLSTEKDDNSSNLAKYCRKLSDECDNLERSMFNLSEQEESGVGMAPILFLSAQRDAAATGKPTCLAENKGNSDDVEVIDLPFQPFPNKSQIVASKSSSEGKCAKESPFDVIEIL